MGGPEAKRFSALGYASITLACFMPHKLFLLQHHVFYPRVVSLLTELMTVSLRPAARRCPALLYCF